MPTKSGPPQIEVAEAVARCQQSGVRLLDVREDDEWAAGHAPHAEHCPLGELNPAEYQKGDTVIAVCRSGNRSQKAAVALHNAGVTAYNLTGGMLAWARSGAAGCARRRDVRPGGLTSRFGRSKPCGTSELT